MASLPQPYAVGYSFTAFQQGQGNNSFPGVNLDTELQNIAASVGGISAFLSGTFASDGSLAAGSVDRESLAADVQLGLPPPKPWAPTTAYPTGVSLTNGPRLYYVPARYTSAAAIGTDIAAGQLVLVQDFSQSIAVSVNSVGNAALQTDAVTNDKIADASVGTAELKDASVTRVKTAANFGLLPIGAEVDYAGLALPSGFLWEDGAAISRATYADLFAALTSGFTADVTAGSSTLTNVVLSNPAIQGISASRVEGFGVGTAVVLSLANGVMSLSAPATGTAKAAAFRFFPHGNGDGAATFNVPDARGRVSAARDDQGTLGVAGRVTSIGALGGGLGVSGGEEKHTLIASEMPNHVHVVNDNGHIHGTTESPHQHTYTRSDADNGVSGTSAGRVSQTPALTTATATGLTVNLSGTGISIQATGGGGAHNNMQPTRLVNKIIFAGV